jgi:tRNA pseudouridine(38-40) synthase
VGTHDFKAFSNKNDQAKECEILNLPIDSIRTITSVQLHQVGDGYYRIDFHLNSALYKMIRTIVGSAFDVAIGKVSQEHVLGLLYESRDRGGNKSKPAPPEGLCLEHVYYDGY